jgi:hypothetical protein
MKSNRKHPFKNRSRWLYVLDAGLGAPRTEPFDVDALPDGNGHVLVPRNFPIRSRRLVEEDCTDGTRRCAEHGVQKYLEFLAVGELTNDGIVQQIPLPAVNVRIKRGTRIQQGELIPIQEFRD